MTTVIFRKPHKVNATQYTAGQLAQLDDKLAADLASQGVVSIRREPLREVKDNDEE